jgi:hypothetical protein
VSEREAGGEKRGSFVAFGMAVHIKSILYANVMTEFTGKIVK